MTNSNGKLIDNENEKPLVGIGMFSKEETPKTILQTFAGYSNKHIPSTELANAGFISLQFGDAVFCVGCYLLLHKFTKWIDPLSVHYCYCESCPLLQVILADKFDGKNVYIFTCILKLNFLCKGDWPRAYLLWLVMISLNF